MRATILQKGQTIPGGRFKFMMVDESKYKIWPTGDKGVLVDFGLEGSTIEKNIKAVSLKNLFVEHKVEGITDLVPSNTSLLISYEPDLIEVEELQKVITEFLYDIEKKETITVPSRLIEVPVLFNDPWTNECVDKYCETIKPIENNIEKIINDNNLHDLDELIYYYTFPQFWVSYIGFWPGLASAVCLDPRFILSIEMYNPPRTFTPAGAIGLGGANTSIYPMESPGGFQLFGITPITIFSIEGQMAPFKDSILLFRVTDRIKFRSINIEEFQEIKKEIDNGTYRYNIIDYDIFDLNAYKEFCDSVSERR